MDKNKFKLTGQKIDIESLDSDLISDQKDEEIERELYEELVPKLRNLHEKIKCRR